jgi:hypothetical protein
VTAAHEALFLRRTRRVIGDFFQADKPAPV